MGVEAGEEVGLAGVEDEHLLPGVDEVIEDPARVTGHRDATHRVGHVLVEAREESKAVLARQVPASAGAGPRDRDAARLAAEGLWLEHSHLEAPLGQLVRGGESADAAAEHRHAGRHVRALAGAQRPRERRPREVAVCARRGRRPAQEHPPRERVGLCLHP